MLALKQSTLCIYLISDQTAPLHMDYIPKSWTCLDLVAVIDIQIDVRK